MQSKAKTVAEYLKALPADRRASIAAIRDVVRANMDPALEEGMQYGMIGWYIPHRVFPAGYHCDPAQPLPFACIASQKQYISLYMMSLYADGTPAERWFRSAWAKRGKKLDMGKCCIRFKSVEDVPLDVIAEAFRRATVAQHLEQYAKIDPRNRTKPTAAKKKTAAKKAASTRAAPRKASAKTAATKKAAAKKK